MGTGRWRVQFVEEPDQLPMVWRAPVQWQETAQAPGDIAKAVLVASFQLLARRGTGPLAWAPPLRHDPIAFLLDTSSDSITLWGPQGESLYRNRAAERLGLGRGEEAWEVMTVGDRRFERRCCQIQYGDTQFLLEIIGEGDWKESSSNAAA